MKAFLTSDEPRPTYTKGFWIGLVFATPVVAYGLRGALANLPDVQLTSFVIYFVGGAVVHDLVLAPVACIVGWVVLRVVPKVAIGPVQAALMASGVVGLISWPFVRGYGITDGEPSFLSRNYATSVLTAWAIIWAIAAAAIVSRVLTARRR
ncbi:MAG: hypothetical protein OSA99_17075 [Acidimicrobiales bacterium]|nr:hypothetical protein [Acidimicrobiales bacterium]